MGWNGEGLAHLWQWYLSEKVFYFHTILPFGAARIENLSFLRVLFVSYCFFVWILCSLLYNFIRVIPLIFKSMIVVTTLSCFLAVTTISQPIKRQAVSVAGIKWKDLGTNNQGHSNWVTLFCLSLFQCCFLIVFRWNCPSSRSTLRGTGKRRSSATCQRHSFTELNWPKF